MSSSWQHWCFEGVLRKLPFLYPLPRGYIHPVACNQHETLGLSGEPPGNVQVSGKAPTSCCSWPNISLCALGGMMSRFHTIFQEEGAFPLTFSIGQAEGTSFHLSQQEAKILRIMPPSQPTVECTILHGCLPVISVQALLAYTTISPCNVGGEKIVLAHSFFVGLL